MCTIITKSLCGFLNQTAIEYYKLEIVNNKVISTELTKSEALELIKDKPELHRIDHNHIIWGDEEFKSKCPEYFKSKVDNECPKELKLCSIHINYRTHDLIVKKDNLLMNCLKDYLNNEFSKLYQNLGKEIKSDDKKIYFPGYVFDYDKFDKYQKLLIKIYHNKSLNLKVFFNNDLDLLMYALLDFNIEPELVDSINEEIEFRIKNGEYEP